MPPLNAVSHIFSTPIKLPHSRQHIKDISAWHFFLPGLNVGTSTAKGSKSLNGSVRRLHHGLYVVLLALQWNGLATVLDRILDQKDHLFNLAGLFWCAFSPPLCWFSISQDFCPTGKMLKCGSPPAVWNGILHSFTSTFCHFILLHGEARTQSLLPLHVGSIFCKWASISEPTGRDSSLRSRLTEKQTPKISKIVFLLIRIAWRTGIKQCLDKKERAFLRGAVEKTKARLIVLWQEWDRGKASLYTLWLDEEVVIQNWDFHTTEKHRESVL